MSASAELGGLTGGGGEDERIALRNFGENIGMAFQIRDDMLDYIGRAGILGKPVGGDLKEKKITLPLIKALEDADDSQRAVILRKVKKRRAKEVVKFVRNSDGLHYAYDKAAEYTSKAKENLNVFPESINKKLLIKLTDFVLRRNK